MCSIPFLFSCTPTTYISAAPHFFKLWHAVTKTITTFCINDIFQKHSFACCVYDKTDVVKCFPEHLG